MPDSLADCCLYAVVSHTISVGSLPAQALHSSSVTTAPPEDMRQLRQEETPRPTKEEPNMTPSPSTSGTRDRILSR